MTCQHITFKAARRGSSADCSNCQMPIIHDGSKWRWEFELDRDLVKRLRAEYQEFRRIGGTA